MTAWGLKERENLSCAYTKDFWAKVCGTKKYTLLRMAVMIMEITGDIIIFVLSHDSNRVSLFVLLLVRNLLT